MARRKSRKAATGGNKLAYTNYMNPLMLEAFGWTWMGMGVLSGAVLGTFFKREDFLGGYDAWKRRLVRLGHIAFFGTGMLCILMAGTLQRHEATFRGGDGLWWAGIIATLLGAGSLLMPPCCALAAWRKGLTWSFVLPVALIGGAVTMGYLGLWLSMRGGR